jgi:hypothetical protein
MLSAMTKYSQDWLFLTPNTKIWVCSTLLAYWLLVRTLRYRRRDRIACRYNVRETPLCCRAQIIDDVYSIRTALHGLE